MNETNRDDKTAFSHHYSRQLMPESMLDAIVQVTGVKERFAAFPEGKRAIQLPDDQVPSYFLATFNRPSRINRTCTRDAEPTVTQALHLISGDTIGEKIRSDKSTLAKLLQQGKSDREIVRVLHPGGPFAACQQAGIGAGAGERAKAPPPAAPAWKTISGRS